MTGELCANIRAGKYDGDWDRVLNMVLEQTIDKVNVVKPRHLAPMHRDAE